MQKEVFIVLGSPNSISGELSEISKSRLDYCIRQYEKGKLVLCTGGWGKHFNISTNAHATYAKQYLIENGLDEKDFLDFALSKNTVDDAVKIKSIVSKLKNINLTIITSDYHLTRVELIFNEILEKYHMKFIGVESKLNKEAYDALVLHEKNATASIMQNGLYY
jgi:uncharacterized SAM-binding protein YcdF (DUF218 family)